MAGVALKLPKNEFEPVRFGAAEALDGQLPPGGIRIGQDAAREANLFGLQMQERLLAVTARLPLFGCKQ